MLRLCIKKGGSTANRLIYNTISSSIKKAAHLPYTVHQKLICDMNLHNEMVAPGGTGNEMSRHCV